MVIGLLLLAFCSVLLAPPASASQYAPGKGPLNYIPVRSYTETDDGGWNDVKAQGQPAKARTIGTPWQLLITRWLIETGLILPDETKGTTNDDAADLTPTGANSQTSGS